MARRVLKTLTIADRVDVIKCLENKESQVSVAKKYGVHQSRVSRIKKDKDKILKEWQNNRNPNRKRIRAGKSENIEDALRQWFHQARSRQISVTGPLLKRKASKLARDFGLTDFKATTGWLERWKVRNAIKLRRLKDVPQDSKNSATETWVVRVVPESDEQESDVERKVDAPVNGATSDADTDVYADTDLSETSVDSANSIDVSPSLVSERKNSDFKLRHHKDVPHHRKDSATETWVVRVAPENDEQESNVECKVDTPVNGIKSNADTDVCANDSLSETSVDSPNSVHISPSPVPKRKKSDDTDNENDDAVSLVTVVQCLHVIRRFMEEKGCRSYESLYDLQDVLYRLNDQEHTPKSVHKPTPSS